MFRLIAFLTGLPGWLEVIVVLFVGLLLFGKRLPGITRSIGQSVIEFKRGLRSANGPDHQQGRANEDRESMESSIERSTNR